MPDRICGCGKTLSFSRSPRCRGCRDLAEKRKQNEIRELKRQQRRFDGFVIAHSCIPPTDSFDPARCTCKKYIKDRSELTRLMSRGEAIDLETRKENYALDVTDIILTGKRRQVPRSSALSQAHIERATQHFHTEKVTSEEAAFVEAPIIEAPVIEEDDDPKFWIEEYGRLNREALQSLVRVCPAEEYDRIRADQWGRQWSAGISEKQQRDKGAIGQSVTKPRPLLLTVPEDAPISPELKRLIDEQQRDDARTKENTYVSR